MADIVDPRAIKFGNEQIRPLAERLRALTAEADAALTDWNGGLNALFPNDKSALADKRETEGVSRLTGEDVNAFMARLVAFQGAQKAAGVSDVVSKPCVRALEVTR